MPDDPRLPRIIELLGAVTGEAIPASARRERNFLATDLFGPLNRTLSLKVWLEQCREAGLHFLGLQTERSLLRATLSNERYTLLMPRSRAAVAPVVDAVMPSQFYRLLVSKQAACELPWEEPQKLADWRPILAPHLRDQPLPQLRGSPRAMRKLKIKSVVMKTQVELRTPEWIIAVLRESNGQSSLGKIIASGEGAVGSATLRKHL